MIKVYSKDDCQRCVSLKNILIDRKLEFEYIEDLKALMMIASKAKIMTAPVVEYNGKIYSMEKFLEVI